MAGHITKRKTKRANGSTRTVWRARYPDPTRGGTSQIERTFETKREAEGWIKRQGANVLDGTHVDPRRGERLLAEVADAWRETWVDLEPKTRAGYEHVLRKHLIGTAEEPARFHRAKVGALSAEVVQRYMNDLSKTLAPKTIRNIYSILRSLLRVAVERRYIAANPCDSVRLPRRGSAANGIRPTRMLFLSPPEVRSLAEAMPSDYRLSIYVAAYCGLRAGELWALRRRDVDPLHGVLYVERALKEINSSAEGIESGLFFGPTKTHASRKLRLPAFLVPMLTDHLASHSPGGNDPDDLLFPSRTGRPVRHNMFYKRIFRPTITGDPENADPEKRREPALPHRLHGLRFHDLRHTAASLSLAVAPNLHVVKERLGHEDIRTTINVYGHLLPSVDEALAEGLDALHEKAATADNVAPLRAT
jgi:integrase